MISRLLALLVALWAIAAGAASAQATAPRHVQLELIPSVPAAAPGATIWIAVRERIERGWHTYWRNPGDSGQATQIRWRLPPGWRAGDIAWPTPQRHRVGPLMNYGYADEAWLLVPLTVPADATAGPANIRAAVSLLVCSDVCVPEDSSLSLTLPVTDAVREPEGRGREVLRRLAAVPRPANVTAATARAPGGALSLAIAGPALQGADAASAWFFPDVGGAIDHAAPQRIERGPAGLTLTLTPGQTPVEPLTGVLVLADRAFEVTARSGAPPAGSGGLGPAVPAGSAEGDLGLPVALALALLGGLVLNLMPCVFPVLALKAVHLAQHARDPAGARWRGVAYTAGVLVSFAVLAGAVIALRAGGEAAGWGFQLQSPAVVLGLALLMVLITLNLLGVFEVGASAQAAAGAAPLRDGLVAAFSTGVLAVVVAAPCTAPFMAGAVGWGLTQDAGVALAVFLALGLGLSLPYLALSFAPALLARLPRPGRWMVILRRVLAIPMAAAATWLMWLLWRQAGSLGLWLALGAAAAACLAAVAWGWNQRRGGAPGLITGAVAGLVLMAVVVPILLSIDRFAAAARPAAAPATELPSEPWSPERVAELRAQGRPVMVNFTADWCVTCELNERVAFSGDGVREALRRTNTAYLVADWTRRDPAIAAELQAQGRAGVPLYLVYPAAGGAPETLPQLLTSNRVVESLERAAR